MQVSAQVSKQLAERADSEPKPAQPEPETPKAVTAPEAQVKPEDDADKAKEDK